MRCIPFVLLCLVSLALTDPRIPSEARHKSRYVNRVPKPANFTSAMLWALPSPTFPSDKWQEAVFLDIPK
jgi:hypothetical protein